MTLSDLAKYSVTWSIARSLFDSWLFVIAISRSIQSATETLPLKRDGLLHVVLTATPRLSMCVFLMQLQISWRRWHRSAWNFAWWYISVPDRKSPLWGRFSQGIPKIPYFGLIFGHLTLNISKTVSRNVTCQLTLNISSTRAFKNVSPER